jgi:hypothetical protein
VSFPRKSVFHEHLQDKNRAGVLNKLTEEFYKKPLKIEYIESKEPSKVVKKETNKPPDQPLVEEVLQVFGGGEIVEIKKL